MIKKLDDLGRIVLPKGLRETLGLKIGDPINIEIKGKKIIITNPKDNFDVEQYIKEELMPNLVGHNELTIGAREMCLKILDRIENN